MISKFRIFSFIFLPIFFGFTGKYSLKNTFWKSDYSKDPDFGDGFKIKFSTNGVSISNGENKYPFYRFFREQNDTLIISNQSGFSAQLLKNAIRNYPCFKIHLHTSDSLLLESLNWQGIYISNTLTSPYIDMEYWKFSELDKNSKAIADSVYNRKIYMYK